MFNLNDSRWGRGDSTAGDSGKSDGKPPEGEPNKLPPEQGPSQQRPNSGPPDLDELWKDFNRKLGGFFGKPNQPPRGSGNGGGFQPDMKSAGIGLGLIVGVLVLIWLGTGFFIVQEGQQAVITQFGRYKSTVNAGFNWRLP